MCTDLRNMVCRVNQFSGQIPSFYNCTKLAEFSGSTNQFSGQLPVFNSPELVLFNCDSNLLSGELPSFSMCTKMTAFTCGSNQFSGTLPSFANCIKLINIRLEKNNFSDGINQLIDDLYSNRNIWDNAYTKTLQVYGGTTQTPSGIYQSPEFYIQANTGVNGNDGNPVSSKEKMYVLVNQNNDQLTTKKYKWSITTN
jgi:hypothetical protein